MTKGSRIPGFYKLTVAERRQKLAAQKSLATKELSALDGGLDSEAADGLVENAVGVFSLPLGIALNFRVDDVDYLVPMAIEEPSVIAAASYAAKMIRAGGGFRTQVSRSIMIGQVQLLDVNNLDAAQSAIESQRTALLSDASAFAPGLCARGGGPLSLEVRRLAGLPRVLVVHIHVDCCDAMGANAVNSIAEGIAPRLAKLAEARAGLRILSNLCDNRIVRVTARIPFSALAHNAGAIVSQGIVSASQFAQADPYRAATHNKGIMNGVDAVLIATGNDWRGVEAGAHAYAARSGSYGPLAVWTEQNQTLIGTLEMPMAVGTVGGSVSVHPAARLSLDLLAISTAHKLASVVGAAGLASNLAALRALSTVGIQHGHMPLHARRVARAAGARGDLVNRVADEIARIGDFHPERATEILDRLRSSQLAASATLLPNTETADPAKETP